MARSGWAETGDVFVVAFPLERTSVSWWSPDPGWDGRRRHTQPPPSAISIQPSAMGIGEGGPCLTDGLWAWTPGATSNSQ